MPRGRYCLARRRISPRSHHQYRAAALATYERLGATWWRDRLRARVPAGQEIEADHVVVHLHQHPGGPWLVRRAGATFVLPRLRGLEHLHVLLWHPDTDVAARTLVGADPTLDQSGLDILDDESRWVLRGRLAELDAALAVTDNADLALVEPWRGGRGRRDGHRAGHEKAARAGVP